MFQGAGVSSALIAVISRKLELSKPEKHVNNFMSDSKLSSRCRNAAASVLQNIWCVVLTSSRKIFQKFLTNANL